jgi:adenosylhomocysteine nucleosidase
MLCAIMLLVIFAVPHESRFFRRTGAARGVRILHTGIGEEAARRALHDEIARERPAAVISSGFAGALDPGLRVGDLIADATVSDADLISALPTSICRGRIHMVSTPADSPAVKARLHLETQTQAVDMETGAIVTECRNANVPLLVLRAISDAAADPIPVPLEIVWDMGRQAPRPFRIAAHLALHPKRISPFVTFVRKTNCAANRLAEALATIAATDLTRNCKSRVQE